MQKSPFAAQATMDYMLDERLCELYVEEWRNMEEILCCYFCDSIKFKYSLR